MTQTMPPKKAFVDTPILVNVLLKPGTLLKRQAVQGLARYSETLLPVYAIKEFKAGPLQNYIWLHNVFVKEKNLSGALARISAITMQQPKKAATATSTLSIFSKNLSPNRAAYVAKHGMQVDLDEIDGAAMRLALHALIVKAWEKRKKVATKIVQPLSCYDEGDLIEKRGNLMVSKSRCSASDCCMAPIFRANKEDTKKLENISRSQSQKREHQKRADVLHILRKDASAISDSECRNLGDAVFAFFAPKEAVILTTNIQDMEPLAQALNKSVESP
jgi:hypothetical protein